jgi:HJR/Mrr/RecB family endonuclease
VVAKDVEVRIFEERLLRDAVPLSIDDVDQLEGYEFEAFLRELYSKMGYQVEQTRLSGDQGADLVVVKFGEKCVIQAKCYSGNVGNYAVQEIVAACSLYQAHKGMVVTNSYFTSAAIELAQANGVELVDRGGLQELIRKYW